DRLADGAQQAQRGQVVPAGQLLAEPGHEGPDQGGGRVVDGDAVALDDLEVPGAGGLAGGALVDHLGQAVGQGSVDLVGVGGDPGQVRGAPVDVLALGVEVRPVRPGGVGEVAAAGVDQPLGLPGGAGGVDDEQRVLGVEGLG